MTDTYIVPASTLPAIAAWVSDRLAINAPAFLHLSAHQRNALLKIEANEQDNYKSILEKACSSLSADYYFDATGQLNIINTLSQRVAEHTITYDDISEIEIAQQIPELTALFLKYDYNENDYQKSILANNTGHHYLENWKEAQTVETQIINQDDAMREIRLRANKHFIRRKIYSVICFVSGALFKKGERLHVFHPVWEVDHIGMILNIEHKIGANKVQIKVEV